MQHINVKCKTFSISFYFFNTFVLVLSLQAIRNWTKKMLMTIYHKFHLVFPKNSWISFLNWFKYSKELWSDTFSLAASNLHLKFPDFAKKAHFLFSCVSETLSCALNGPANETIGWQLKFIAWDNQINN